MSSTGPSLGGLISLLIITLLLVAIPVGIYVLIRNQKDKGGVHTQSNKIIKNIFYVILAIFAIGALPLVFYRFLFN